jgi:EAL domain-containing protein (putative c-di-GMP-specific phosphodiesterase class I)
MSSCQVRMPVEIPALGRAATGAGLTMAFQPIVSLPSLQVVGFESLARWTATPDLSPSTVFDYAHRTGVATQLDRRCFRAALHSALNGKLPVGTQVFINIEPTSRLQLEDIDDMASRLHGAPFSVIVEITERHLCLDLVGLLRTVQLLRERHIGIALDDVGTDPAVLGVLELLQPDVIKLDATYLQGSALSSKQAAVLQAVHAHRRDRGAKIVAEGIETAAQQLTARTRLKADFAQGYLLGRPQALHQRAA